MDRRGVPFELPGIEPVLNGRFDDLEIRGYVEIARCEEAVMSNMVNLSNCFTTVFTLFFRQSFDARQDRIRDRLESLRNSG